MPSSSRPYRFFLQYTLTSPSSLANDAQATVYDQTLDDPATAMALPAGYASGVRVDITVSPAALQSGLVEWVLCLLPLGMTVPTFTTESIFDRNRRFIWGHGALLPRTTTGNAALTTQYWGTIELATRRHYNMNDRFVVTIANRTGVAFGSVGARVLVGGDLWLHF